MVGVASAEDMIDNEEPLMEDEVTKVDKLAAKIAKALKDKANKDTSDQNNLKQARTIQRGSCQCIAIKAYWR